MNKRPEIADESQFYAPMEHQTAQLRENIWRIMPPSPAANVYLIRDTRKTILIDSGIYESYDFLTAELGKLGVRPVDIDLIINTHEHFDHTGGNARFAETALIAAHRAAAAKITLYDEYVTHMKENKQVGGDTSVHLWLNEGDIIQTGDYKFRVLHTPGHTSGCICLYEAEAGFIFTGDTVVAGHYLTPMLESGSGAEFVTSLERLLALNNLHVMYPGHSGESLTPYEDIAWAKNAGIERLKTFYEQQPLGGKRRLTIRAGSQEV